jgi:pimeloyl-ACP methyl ester carboxylesterase
MDSRQQFGPSGDQPAVHLALLMLPGRNHTRPSQFSPSPLLVNPGGPGTSGIDFVLLIGKNLQDIVGVDQDIIGFDPRGIGSTTPRADCWAKRLTADLRKDVWRGFFHRTAWEISGKGAGSITSDFHALSFLDSRVRGVSQLCKEMHDRLGVNSIFPYLGSTHTARDMLRIVDAWEGWRMSDSITAEQRSNEFVRGKLVYWGFSYGSFLGATFATMFPDRVGRLILDGVVDVDENVAPFWISNLRDTDRVLHHFFRYCHIAGEKCDLYRPGDEVIDIEQRYETILSSLENSTMTFVEPEGFRPVIVTAADVKALVFGMLYIPVRHFPDLAQFLNAIYERNWEELTSIFAGPDLADLCNAANAGIPIQYLPDDSGHALSCSDKLNLVSLK